MFAVEIIHENAVSATVQIRQLDNNLEVVKELCLPFCTSFLCFSSDNSCLAVPFRNELHGWDVNTGMKLWNRSFGEDYDIHINGVNASPTDAKLLVTLDSQHEMWTVHSFVIIEASNGQDAFPSAESEASVSVFGFGRSGDEIFGTYVRNPLVPAIIDAATRSEIILLHGHIAEISNGQVKGDRAFTIDSTMQTMVWQLDDTGGTLLFRLPLESELVSRAWLTRDHHLLAITAEPSHGLVVFSPAGERLRSCSLPRYGLISHDDSGYVTTVESITLFCERARNIEVFHCSDLDTRRLMQLDDGDIVCCQFVNSEIVVLM